MKLNFSSEVAIVYDLHIGGFVKYVFKKRIDFDLTTSAAKKRKILNECSVFNDEWTAKYCFMSVGSKAVCLLCRECVSVFNEYDLKKHHQIKHLDFRQPI